MKLASLCLLCLCAVSCQRAAAQAPPPAAAAPAANLSAAAPSPPASWTDPRIVAELVKNCAFDPDALPPEQQKAWIGVRNSGARGPLSCALSFDQSCVYDPCWDDETQHCKPRCAKTCGDCGTGCATSCETCKKSCSDDTCRTACAQQCASCRKDCVRTRDRCTTGTCSEEFGKCRKKLKADWLKNGCPAVCRAFLRCQKPCMRKHEAPGEALDACDKPCQPKDHKGCNFQFCGGSFAMGIDPLEWR